MLIKFLKFIALSIFCLFVLFMILWVTTPTRPADQSEKKYSPIAIPTSRQTVPASSDSSETARSTPAVSAPEPVPQDDFSRKLSSFKPSEPVPEPNEPTCDEQAKQRALAKESEMYEDAKREAQSIYKSDLQAASATYGRCQSQSVFQSSCGTSYEYALKQAEERLNRNLSDIESYRVIHLREINAKCY